MTCIQRPFFILVVFLFLYGLFNLENTSLAQEVGEVFIDASGVEMVFVPEGELVLGIDRTELENLCQQLGEQDVELCVASTYETIGIDSNPTVFVHAFWIDRYEVTIQQFAEYCNIVHDTVLSDCIELDESLRVNMSQPQVNISWYSASAFCNYRGSRLPTEIEWEYAASGSENFVYPWGNMYIRENTKGSSASFSATYPVGSLTSNRSWVGAYDMSGNAAEWVEDYFYTYGGQIIEPPTGTIGEHSASNLLERHRVVRGGSWEGRLWTLTTFWREHTTPFAESEYIGFRCARIHT